MLQGIDHILQSGHHCPVLTDEYGYWLTTATAVERRNRLVLRDERHLQKRAMNNMAKFVRKMSTDDLGHAYLWMWDVSNLHCATYYMPPWEVNQDTHVGYFNWNTDLVQSFNWWDMLCSLPGEDFKKVFGVRPDERIRQGDIRGITRVAWVVNGDITYWWGRGGSDFRLSVWCGGKRWVLKTSSKGRGVSINLPPEVLGGKQEGVAAGMPEEAFDVGTDAEDCRMANRNTTGHGRNHPSLYGGFTDPIIRNRMSWFERNMVNGRPPYTWETDYLAGSAHGPWKPWATTAQQGRGSSSGDGAAALAGPGPAAPAARAPEQAMPKVAAADGGSPAQPRNETPSAWLAGVTPSPTVPAAADTQPEAAAKAASQAKAKKAHSPLPQSSGSGTVAAKTSPAALAEAVPPAFDPNSVTGHSDLAAREAALEEEEAATWKRFDELLRGAAEHRKRTACDCDECVWRKRLSDARPQGSPWADPPQQRGAGPQGGWRPRLRPTAARPHGRRAAEATEDERPNMTEMN